MVQTIDRQIVRVAMIAAVLVLTPYFFAFNGGLEKDSEKWAHFGTYVGGTLGPVYGLLAFIVALRALAFSRKQTDLQNLLSAVHRYEQDFEAACAKTVTCEAPWVWGKSPSDTATVERISLRTLLYSDTIDWERHLTPLIVGHGFQVLPNGEISQDREVVFHASLALDGLFKYLAVYEEQGGDQSLIAYLSSRYEVPRNRLSDAAASAAEPDC